ncbi:hypothetical protein [Rossellomorea marisflavi]|uniref:hypothetical protein n=1 Tax=Rossellomorea marisflavi TaxID=189381 RepID=UPI00345D6EC9
MFSSLYETTQEILLVQAWVQHPPAFRNYNREKIEVVIERHNIEDKAKNEILSLMDNDKKIMESKLLLAITQEMLVKANKLRNEYNNQYSKTILFQSKEVAELGNLIKDKQRELQVHLQFTDEINQIKILAAQIRSIRGEIQKQMQSELSLGYYEETKKKSS